MIGLFSGPRSVWHPLFSTALVGVGKSIRKRAMTG